MKDNILDKFMVKIEMLKDQMKVTFGSDGEAPDVIQKAKSVTVICMYLESVISGMPVILKEGLIEMLETLVNNLKNKKTVADETIIRIDKDEFEKQLKELKNNEDE